MASSQLPLRQSGKVYKVQILTNMFSLLICKEGILARRHSLCCSSRVSVKCCCIQRVPDNLGYLEDNKVQYLGLQKSQGVIVQVLDFLILFFFCVAAHFLCELGEVQGSENRYQNDLFFIHKFFIPRLNLQPWST